MKVIKKEAILIAGIATMLFACNKKDNILVPVDTTPKVKTYTTGSGNVTSHQYDAQGRKTVESSGIFSTNYTYSASQVSEKVYMSNVLDDETIYELNGNGYVTRYSDPGSVFETRCEYDATGYMTRDYNLQSGVITVDRRYFYAASGRLDSLYSYDGGVLKRRDVYVTDETHLNTIGTENLGLLFFGKQSKGVITRITRTTFATGNVNQLDYTHTYDANGRIITETLNGISTTTYAYY